MFINVNISWCYYWIQSCATWWNKFLARNPERGIVASILFRPTSRYRLKCSLHWRGSTPLAGWLEVGLGSGLATLWMVYRRYTMYLHHVSCIYTCIFDTHTLYTCDSEKQVSTLYRYTVQIWIHYTHTWLIMSNMYLHSTRKYWYTDKQVLHDTQYMVCKLHRVF